MRLIPSLEIRRIECEPSEIRAVDGNSRRAGAGSFAPLYEIKYLPSVDSRVIESNERKNSRNALSALIGKGVFCCVSDQNFTRAFPLVDVKASDVVSYK